jgi:diguanylate cyclase (GGDEF)-like protein/PAS domain S-box-containing protein
MPGVPSLTAFLTLLRRIEVGWFVLVISLLITLWAWLTIGTGIARHRSEIFIRHLHATETLVDERLRVYEQILRGCAGLLMASGMVSQEEWRAYTGHLNIQERHPGLQGIGFARPLLQKDRETYVRQRRIEINPLFNVWPQGDGPDHVVVDYIEPANLRNRRAYGFDLLSDPVRRAALERARDTGVPILSARISLMMDDPGNTQPGFLLFIPVYRSDAVLNDAAQRRAALLGYVYGEFTARDLLNDILSGHLDGIHLVVYDGATPAPAAFLYRSEPPLPLGRAPEFTAVTTLAVAGGVWTLEWSSLPGFGTHKELSLMATTALLAGGALSLLLFFTTWSSTTARAHNLTLAQRVTTTIQEKEIWLQSITAALKEGVYLEDHQGRVTLINPEAEKLLGWSGQEVTGYDAHSHFHAHGRSGLAATGLCLLQNALRSGRSFRSDDDIFRRKDGTTLAVALVASPVQRQGKIIGAVVIFRDITECKRAEQALQENHRLRFFFDHSREILFLLNGKGCITDVNTLACNELGQARQALIGMDLARFISNVRSGLHSMTVDDLLKRVRRLQSVMVEAQMLCQESRSIYIEALFSLIDANDRESILVAVRDITRYKQVEANLKRALSKLEEAKSITERNNQELTTANEELLRVSMLDGLTGIANRRSFDDYLLREWGRAVRNGYSIALILADIDHFKDFNDCYGHQAGDDSLRRVARTLAGEARRPADLVARYGGEELAAILPETTLEGALQIAEKMRRAVERLAIPHSASSSRVLTLSFGVAALVPAQDVDPAQIIQAADRALYEAKAKGRNRVCPCDQSPVSLVLL